MPFDYLDEQPSSKFEYVDEPQQEKPLIQDKSWIEKAPIDVAREYLAPRQAETLLDVPRETAKGMTRLGMNIVEAGAKPIDTLYGMGATGMGLLRNATDYYAGKLLPESIYKPTTNPMEMMPQERIEREAATQFVEPYSSIESFQKAAVEQPEKIVMDALIAKGAMTPKIAEAGGVDALLKPETYKQAAEFYKQERKQKLNNEANRIAGQVAQGKIKDINKAKEQLATLNPEEVKTYQDATRTMNNRVEALSGVLDEALQKDTRVFPLNSFSKEIKMGENTVKQNYVVDAISHLKEFYEKTNNPKAVQDLYNVAEKFSREGLTVKELNDLSRQYGNEFGGKAFSKGTNEPLTSVNAVAYENTRKGLKNDARKLFDNPVYKEIDSQIASAIRTRELLDKMAEKVNKMQQSVQPYSLASKVGRAGAKIADLASIGTLKPFIEALTKRGEGRKMLNALDLERMLSKNLTKLNKLAEAGKSPAEYAKRTEIIPSQKSLVPDMIEEAQTKRIKEK